MQQEPTYIGIDVAKAQVDVAVHPTGMRWQAPYTEEGVQELLSRVQALQPTYERQSLFQGRVPPLDRSQLSLVQSCP